MEIDERNQRRRKRRDGTSLVEPEHVAQATPVAGPRRKRITAKRKDAFVRSERAAPPLRSRNESACELAKRVVDESLALRPGFRKSLFKIGDVRDFIALERTDPAGAVSAGKDAVVENENHIPADIARRENGFQKPVEALAESELRLRRPDAVEIVHHFLCRGFVAGRERRVHLAAGRADDVDAHLAILHDERRRVPEHVAQEIRDPQALRGRQLLIFALGLDNRLAAHLVLGRRNHLIPSGERGDSAATGGSARSGRFRPGGVVSSQRAFPVFTGHGSQPLKVMLMRREASGFAPVPRR